MMNPQHIVDIGKSAATEQLKNVGWDQIMAGEQVPSPVDIIAVRGNQKLLVSITPTVYPKQPEEMADHLKDQIVQMAQNHKAKAYQAKVVLNQDMTSINRMSWKKL
jgi:ribosomal protein S7